MRVERLLFEAKLLHNGHDVIRCDQVVLVDVGVLCTGNQRRDSCILCNHAADQHGVLNVHCVIQVYVAKQSDRRSRFSGCIQKIMKCSAW